MNAQVGFKEVQAYAQTHNVDFKTAAKQLGLSEKDAKMLEESMNGGANWGKIMDEVTFNPQKADVYKAEAKAKQQEDVKNHPEKNEKQENKDFFNFTDANGNFSFAETGKTLIKTALLPLAILGGCSDDHMEVTDNSKVDVDSKTDVTVTISSADQKALIEAMNKGFEALLAKINELGLSMKEYGDQIVALLVQNNKKLDGIANELKNNGEQNDEIIKILTNINNTVSNLKDLTAGISADIKVNGQSVKTQLDSILNAINSNNLNLGGLNDQMAKLQDLLREVINNQETSLVFQENSNMNEKKILDAINNIKYADESKQLATIVDILKDIKGITLSIEGKLDAIQNVISDAGDNGKEIKALLDKVLEKLDTMDENQKANANAILDAISNIKVEGGNIDLSSIEKMLAELLKQAQKNGDILASIDAKADVINLTIERAKDEILAKLGNNDDNAKDILAKLDAFMDLSTGNTEAILKKMDTVINILNNIKDKTYDDSKLMAKLDDILAAIKDHKITVDVTGKVTCECNCGKPHEGILGDLNKILG